MTTYSNIAKRQPIIKLTKNDENFIKKYSLTEAEKIKYSKLSKEERETAKSKKIDNQENINNSFGLKMKESGKSYWANYSTYDELETTDKKKIYRDKWEKKHIPKESSQKVNQSLKSIILNKTNFNSSPKKKLEIGHKNKSSKNALLGQKEWGNELIKFPENWTDENNNFIKNKKMFKSWDNISKYSKKSKANRNIEISKSKQLVTKTKSFKNALVGRQSPKSDLEATKKSQNDVIPGDSMNAVSGEKDESLLKNNINNVTDAWLTVIYTQLKTNIKKNFYKAKEYVKNEWCWQVLDLKESNINMYTRFMSSKKGIKDFVYWFTKKQFFTIYGVKWYVALTYYQNNKTNEPNIGVVAFNTLQECSFKSLNIYYNSLKDYTNYDIDSIVNKIYEAIKLDKIISFKKKIGSELLRPSDQMVNHVPYMLTR